MKITNQQLEQHLTSELRKVYLVAGDELLLVQESVDQIRKTAKQRGYTERTRLTAENNTWSEQLQAPTTRSLFNDKTLLEIDFRTAKFNQSNSKILEKYLSKIPLDTLVLIQMNKLDNKISQTNWFKTLEKIGVIINIWPINNENLPQWIAQRAQKMQLNLSASSSRLLAEQVEGNLLAANNELEKLALWQLDNNNKSADDSLENMIMQQSRFDIFQLTEAALNGNLTRCQQILSNLLNVNTEAVLILWAITRELRLLTRIMQEYTLGKNLSVLLQNFYVREKSKANFQKFLQRHDFASCVNLLSIAANADRVIKGAERGNIHDILESLIFAIAGKNLAC